MSYVPRPGTVPARVIEHLRSLPPGTELTTKQLADAVETDGVAAYLQVVAAHGLLVRRKEGAGPTCPAYWRLGTPEEQEAAARTMPLAARPVISTTEDERAGDAAAKLAHAPTPGPISLGWKAPTGQLYPPPPEDDEPAAVKPDLTPEPAPTSAPEEINTAPQREQHLVQRAWFSSDGQLVIEAGEHEFVFPRLEARQLVRTIRELGEAWA